MGCWNKTCGISKLHIYAGSPVYVFVLEQNTDFTDRCYSTAFWAPLMLPFESEYNDYGGGENSSGPAFNLIMDAVAKNLVEMEVGENEYHDIAVKRDGFGEEEFFNSVHENRLKTVSYNGTERLVDFVMLRKDVVDYIFKNRVIEEYVGDGKGTGGYDNNYITYKFADILADIPEFMDKLEAPTKELPSLKTALDDLRKDAVANKDKIEAIEDLIFEMRITRGFEGLFDWKHPNKVGKWVRGDNYRNSSLLRPADAIAKSLRAGNRAEAEALLIEHLKAQFIDSFMNTTRHNWAPAGHEGSQSADLDDHRLLCSAITTALDVEHAEWAAENEE